MGSLLPFPPLFIYLFIGNILVGFSTEVCDIFAGYKFGRRLTKWSVGITRLMAERGGAQTAMRNRGRGWGAFRSGIAANKRETLFH